MTTVDFDIFEAFRAMNAPEDVARNLAAALARRASDGLATLKDDLQDDLRSIKADMALVSADTGRIQIDLAVLNAPVPRAHEVGVFDRALKFVLNLRQGQRCPGSTGP